MLALLINPEKRTLETAELPGGNRQIDAIYKHLACDTIDAVRPAWESHPSDIIYVDDEALIKGPVYQFFGVLGHPQPVAGRGLVVGTDEEGEDRSPDMTRGELIHRLFWIERLTNHLWSLCPVASPAETLVLTLDQIESRLSPT